MKLDYKLVFAACLPYLLLSAWALQFNSFTMDEYTYLLMGASFARGDFLNAPDLSRFPVFPALLGIVFAATGASILAARLVAILAGLAAVLLAYFIAAKFFGEKAGFWAAVLLGSSPFYAFLSSRILSESLFFFLLLTGAYLAYRCAEDRRHLLALGPVTALLVLTRFFGLYLGLVALAYWWKRGKLAMLASKEFLLGAAGFVLVSAPWLYFSQLVSGSPLGLLQEFFTANVQLFKGGFALPDLIPSYLLFLPFILGAGVLVFVLRFRTLLAHLRNEKIFFLLAAVLAITLSLEAYGFLHFRLLRYLVPVAPFLALLGGFLAAEDRKKVFGAVDLRILLIAIVLANAVAGGYIIHRFGVSDKQAGYYEAGTYLRSLECGSIHSNFDRVVLFLAGKPPAPAESAECIAVSTHDPHEYLRVPAGAEIVYEKRGFKIYRRGV